ncbi:hypothetical protein J4416_04220 [Candidatus Pacearchaeota archaeon]|nr:hypothetical protein [Candidatus Pacearchaeota archaeon]
MGIERDSSKREKHKYLSNTNYVDDLVATGVVGALATYGLSKVDFLPHLRESLYNARHATGTVKDIVLGGPEGMRGAKSLDEAISIVDSAREMNVEAGNALEGYLTARKELVGDLVRTYAENETLVREAERLKLQVEGVVKNLFEIGNDVKPQSFKDAVDSRIIIAFGKAQRALGNSDYKGLSDSQIVEVALEKSGRMKEFYKQAREFYDASEKNEHTIREFCQYLEKVKIESEGQNQRFNELFPEIISQVREGYSVEDIFLAQRHEKDFSRSRVEDTGTKVSGFREGVDNTYEGLRQEIPIRKYSDKNWVDFATNPAALGLAVALIGYAGSKLFLPSVVRSPITKVLAAPITLPLRGIGKASKTAISGGKRLIDKFKKHGDS